LISLKASQPERHAEVKQGLFCPKKALEGLFWSSLGRFFPFKGLGARRLERAVLYFLRGCCVKK